MSVKFRIGASAQASARVSMSTLLGLAAVSAIISGCPRPAVECGDGEIGDGEICDDGNAAAGDGCSLACLVEAGFECTGMPSVCTPTSTCGDGTVDTGEDCDDSGESATCDDDCTDVACGDSNTNTTAGEECDDGNTTGGDGCSASCITEPATCGDGTCDLAGTETCANCVADCEFDPTCVGVTCGDDMVGGTEECDGTDLDMTDCMDLGFDGGALACTGTCTFDDTGCFECGDLIANGAEDCDGTDLDTTTCADLGYVGGALACSATCTFDETGCNDCGDAFADPGEECDGVDLNGFLCTDLGFGGGTLDCTATCTYDTTACDPCGNDLVEGTETCDGTDLAGQTCVTQGFGPGTLTCNATCSAFDTTGCPLCGNNVINSPEQCDGTDFGVIDCLALGFDGGTLACTAACTHDTTGCTTCGNGILEGTEICDDSNTTDGDGCDATCTTEPGQYEQFTGILGDDNDLCGTTLTFSWNGTSYGPPGTADGIDALPTTPGTGVVSTPLALLDDGTALITLVAPFNFFGIAQTTMNVNANGNVTFGGGSADFTESVAEHFAVLPRASVFWHDFNPTRGGLITVDEFADRVVVTWEELQPFDVTSIARSTFQVTFSIIGDDIQMTYINVGETAGLVGLGDGSGATAPPEDDFWTGTRSEGFHELFTGSHDLTNTRMLYVRTASLNGFVPETQATGIGSFPDTAGTGLTSMPIVLGDDATTVVTFPVGQTFNFFGVSYGSMNVNSNGNITFGLGAGDTNFGENIADHYTLPRVSLWWDDLDPSAGGTITYDAFADRITVTWNSVPLFGSPTTVSAQVTLFTSGANVNNVRMTYLGVASTTGLVGASSGTGTAPKCPIVRTDVNRESDGVFELFTGGGVDDFDLDGDELLLTPDPFAAGGYGITTTAAGFVTYPTAVGSGTVQTLVVGPIGGASDCDDCGTSVTLLGFRFPFYGDYYSQMFINSNGSITFGRADTDFGESINDHLSPEPRIAVYWDDLRTSAVGAGSIVLDEFPNRVVITYDAVATFGSGTTPEVFVQLELFDDGTIVWSYLPILEEDALVGVSMGGRIPVVAVPEVNFQ